MDLNCTRNTFVIEKMTFRIKFVHEMFGNHFDFYYVSIKYN